VNAPGQHDLLFQVGLYQSSNPTRRWLHRRRLDWLISRIDQARNSTSSSANACALEVGIGCGVLTRHLSQRFRTLALDINESFLQAARALPGVSTCNADVCSLQEVVAAVHDHSQQQGASLAVCSEVLEHLDQPRAAMAALYSALRPGGLLIVTTPQRTSIAEKVAGLLRFRAMRTLARWCYGEPVAELEHISLMTPGEVRAYATACGFNVLEHDRFGAYLPVIAEFGGRPGQALLACLEAFTRRRGRGRHLLWTQAWVFQRPPLAEAAHAEN
jgi:SAM-dependent methyltransferase